MSVMIIDDTTYLNCSEALYSLAYKSPVVSGAQDLLRMFNNHHGCRHRGGLSQALLFARAINHRTYARRYRYEEPSTYERSLSVDIVRSLPNKWQLLKSLECIRYNISDYDGVFYEKAQFQIQRLIDIVTDYCHETETEYKNATWS